MDYSNLRINNPFFLSFLSINFVWRSLWRCLVIIPMAKSRSVSARRDRSVAQAPFIRWFFVCVQFDAECRAFCCEKYVSRRRTPCFVISEHVKGVNKRGYDWMQLDMKDMGPDMVKSTHLLVFNRCFSAPFQVRLLNVGVCYL